LTEDEDEERRLEVDFSDGNASEPGHKESLFERGRNLEEGVREKTNCSCSGNRESDVRPLCSCYALSKF